MTDWNKYLDYLKRAYNEYVKPYMPSKKTIRKASKALPMLFLWLFVLGAIVGLSVFIYIALTLPDPEVLASRRVTESTKIYDRTGQVVLYDIFDEEKRTIVPWDQIPEWVKLATLASEDDDFYEHKGIDFSGILRSIWTDITTGEFAQGGSTITQQLIKKALLTDDKSPIRKIREILIAIEVEKKFTKDEILWMYLNQIPYGSTAYGIEAAAKSYFGKSASELTLNESAILASIIQSPTYYYRNQELLMARKNNLLKKMLDTGKISQADYDTALAEQPDFYLRSTDDFALHFVLMVKDYLEQKYGADTVTNGGLRIITTLDADLQAKAETLTQEYAEINRTKYKAANAATTIIDPRTGELLAMVGSADYSNLEIEGNYNVAIGQRQPGSSFKPFAYAAAIAKGYPDFTVLFDTKTEFNPNCSPDGNQIKDRYGLDCYHPRNYDGRYRGPVTLRQSLAQSLNVNSVKTLYLAGIQETMDLAERMGISTLGDKSRYGLSLVLGGAEVKLVDMVSAYGVFANEGIRNPWYFIKRVEKADGTVLEEYEQQPQRVLDEQVARMISDILSDNNARAPVFGVNNLLHIPGQPVAAKTGTTQENRDAWVVGYSPSVAVGVWVGNNRQESMTQEGAGISAAGPLWNSLMKEALALYPAGNFTKPDPMFSSTPMLNGSYNSSSGVHTILHYINPGDSQYPNWEWSVRSWAGTYLSPTPAPISTPEISPSPTPNN